MARAYRLGHRQTAVDRTARSILDAARDLISGGSQVSVAAIAHKAGVSRITVYNRFGSRQGVLQALSPAALPPSSGLKSTFDAACARWAANPALYRHLPVEADHGVAR